MLIHTYCVIKSYLIVFKLPFLELLASNIAKQQCTFSIPPHQLWWSFTLSNLVCERYIVTKHNFCVGLPGALCNCTMELEYFLSSNMICKFKLFGILILLPIDIIVLVRRLFTETSETYKWVELSVISMVSIQLDKYETALVFSIKPKLDM